MRFGALDSAPVRHGGTVAGALADAVARAPRLEELGCHRLWFTEHHLAPDVASSAPLTLAGQAATRTSCLRVGAGGVMIRNHAPLVAAEQAATLSLLHPGRVDLGLGRSGGSEPTTDARIRRTVLPYDSFDDDVRETVHLLDRLGADGVEVFVLAASPGTATFAAREGLGLAVAGHVAPAELDRTVAAYRRHFRARSGPGRPSVVACLPVVVGASDDEARWWFRSVQRRYLDRLRTGGAPLRLPDDAELDWSASERYRVDAMLEAALVGCAATVRDRLRDVVERWAPDEVMAMTDLPDPVATLGSFGAFAQVVAEVTVAARVGGAPVTVPAAVAGLLRGVPEIGAQEQAFPFVTVDPAGFPHAALLSRMELDVGPGDADVRAALRSRQTRANLERDGRAALIAVEGRTAHYVKLRLVRSTAVHDLLGCVFAVVEHKPDSLGIPLTPILYEVSAEIARAERWDATVEVLAALR